LAFGRVLSAGISFFWYGAYVRFSARGVQKHHIPFGFCRRFWPLTQSGLYSPILKAPLNKKSLKKKRAAMKWRE
jgi:hypothetical protein